MSMAPSDLFPFEVGQEAESKSFLRGYRGAWFRCKINKFIQRNDQIKALLEFYDYPGEKMHTTQLYQKPSRNSIGSTDERTAQLILRPSFPPLYRENQIPDPSIISDLIVIVNDRWKVGDLVDWWSDGCFWSGEVIHLLEEDKVKVKLPDPPVGEGKSYDALCNDLRPSLNWSLEHGWTVPENEASCCCARLVWPQTKDKRGNEDLTMASNSTSLASCKTSSSRLTASLLPQRDDEQENYEQLAYGVTVLRETGASVSSRTRANRLLTSVSSRTRANRLLSPTGSVDPIVNGTPDNEKEMEVHSTPTGTIDPYVNEASRNCCSREDNEMEMEVHSTKVSLDLDNDLKEIGCGSDKVSCTVPTSSRPLEAIEISKTGIGREEKRERVRSTTMDSDDSRRETTRIFRTSQQGSVKEEDDTEVQSIDMDDADGGDMLSTSDMTFITTRGSLLPPVEMNEASTQSCAMEVAECGSESQSTIKNLLDLDTARNDTTSKIAKSFVTLGALPFPGARHSPETNDTSTKKLVTGNTEKEVESMNINVDAEDGKRATTNSLEKALESHEVVSPSDKDEHSLRQLSEGLRITENHHPSVAAEVNAIESSVLELEELANKIKWLKGVIIFGLQLSNAMKPTWKISET